MPDFLRPLAGPIPAKAPYAWRLTYDHLDGVKDDTAGPRNIDHALLDRLNEAVKAGRTHAADFPDVQWFRMYDDDGELYYTGVRTGEAAQYGSEDGFEPMDDFGTPNAGVTSIHYLNVAKTAETGREVWESL